MAVLLVGVLAFTRALTQSLELGEKNRQSALATAAAQGILEQLYAADLAQVFALYNGEPNDDPDGKGSAPGARFAVEGLDARAQDGGRQGTILFPVDAGGELKEDLVGQKQINPIDMNLDGILDDADHSGDYRVLPVVVRIAWHDGEEERQLEVATILGAR